MRIQRYTVQRGLAIALLGTVLTACGAPGASPASNASRPLVAQPSAQPSAASASTPASASPQPSSRVAAQPAQPILAFNPKSGSPGTTVQVSGTGYKPGRPVVVRLGMPQPVGEALVSAVPDADGRWSANLVLPERLLSGDPITGDKLRLVVMDEANQALASAPFGFTANAGPTREAAVQTVRDMLGTFGHGDIRPYLTAELQQALTTGQTTDETLGLHSIGLQSFDVRPAEDRPSEVLFVPATLHYAEFAEERVYELVVEQERWRVHGSSLVATRPAGGDNTSEISNPFGPEWYVMTTADYNADGVKDVIYAQKSDVQRQASVTDPAFSSSSPTVRGLMIVKGPVENLHMLLSVSDRSVTIGGDPVIGFGDGQTGVPAAFAVALEPAAKQVVTVVPLNEDGSQLVQRIVLFWNAYDGEFRVVEGVPQ